MIENEARLYVYLVLDKLLEWNILTPESWCKMDKDQRQILVELVIAESKEYHDGL